MNVNSEPDVIDVMCLALEYTDFDLKKDEKKAKAGIVFSTGFRDEDNILDRIYEMLRWSYCCFDKSNFFCGFLTNIKKSILTCEYN